MKAIVIAITTGCCFSMFLYLNENRVSNNEQNRYSSSNNQSSLLPNIFTRVGINNEKKKLIAE
jgi:phage gp36-like protein